MIVITLTSCPPALRGDLSKWLLEVNVGVFVGRVSARVRDRLWERVCGHVREGRATMVHQARNEQGLEFKVANSEWIPTDFDGLVLMLRPDAAAEDAPDRGRPGFSKASRMLRARQMAGADARRRVQCAGEGTGDFPDAAKTTGMSGTNAEGVCAEESEGAGAGELAGVGAGELKGVGAGEQNRLSSYVVIDLETTGFSPEYNDIIELGALRVRDGKEVDSFSRLVRPFKPIPPKITALTGITEEMTRMDGCDLAEALRSFAQFIGEDALVAHNAGFDLSFLNAACRRIGLPALTNRVLDTLPLSRRLLGDVDSHKLGDLADYFGFRVSEGHRVLLDCRMTQMLYAKLNEFQ